MQDKNKQREKREIGRQKERELETWSVSLGQSCAVKPPVEQSSLSDQQAQTDSSSLPPQDYVSSSSLLTSSHVTLQDPFNTESEAAVQTHTSICARYTHTNINTLKLKLKVNFNLCLTDHNSGSVRFRPTCLACYASETNQHLLCNTLSVAVKVYWL